jgi:hypothetical protein
VFCIRKASPVWGREWGYPEMVRKLCFESRTLREMCSRFVQKAPFRSHQNQKQVRFLVWTPGWIKASSRHQDFPQIRFELHSKATTFQKSAPLLAERFLKCGDGASEPLNSRAESKGGVMFCEYAKQTSQGRENFKATALKLFLTESVLAVPPISTKIRNEFTSDYIFVVPRTTSESCNIYSLRSLCCSEMPQSSAAPHFKNQLRFWRSD